MQPEVKKYLFDILDEVDSEIIWAAIRNHLPKLMQEVREILGT